MKSIWAKYSKVLCALRSEEMHEKVFDRIFFPTLKRFSTPTSTEREGTLPLPSPRNKKQRKIRCFQELPPTLVRSRQTPHGPKGMKIFEQRICEKKAAFETFGRESSVSVRCLEAASFVVGNLPSNDEKLSRTTSATCFF